MTIFKTELDALNLQLFADGGDGGTGADGSSADSGFATTQGVKDNPLENVKYGKQEDSVQTTDAHTTETEPTVDRKTEFKKLIKGEYKDEFGEEVQSIVQNRLKGTKEQVARLESLTPLLEMIAKKYGVDSNDVEALVKAIEDDDSYFADEAMERGITVDELKRIRKIERENEDLKKQMEEQKKQDDANKLYQKWFEESESAKQFYPNLDVQAELKNEDFARLLMAGVDVKSAYEVIHKDEIIGGAMQYAAKTVEKKVVDKIRANGNRPVENGISSNSAAVVKTDVSQLTDADMDEIIRRVRNGEKISF